MKKWGVITFIFLLAVIVLPVNSFGSPAIFWNQGDVNGLAFTFEPALPVDIGIYSFDAAYVKIETRGRELVIIDQALMYYYFGNYNSGFVYIWGTMPDSFDGDGYPIDNNERILPDIAIPMRSASLVEQFQLDGPLTTDPFRVVAPDDTSLIFKAKLVVGSDIVNFMLIIQNGIVMFP